MPPHDPHQTASGSHHQEYDHCASSDASHASEAYPPSPIEVLPPELLTGVFYWAAQAPFFYDSHESRSSPNNIAAVCRHWRELSLSIPTLWSNFSQNHVMGTRDILPDKVQAYLQKSKDAPLNVLIFIMQNIPHLYELLELIDRNRHRCVAINMLIPRQSRTPNDFLNLADMPRIEDLVLLVQRWRYDLDLSNAHHLTTLHYCYDQRFELHLGEHPLRNLTNVDMASPRYGSKGGFSLADCMALLRATPELEKLSVMIYKTYDWDDPVEELHPIVHLSKLTKLELFYEKRNTVDDLKFVLQHLLAPNLTEVDVGILEGLTGSEDCGITDFLKKTQPNAVLRHFTSNTLFVPELERCLSLLPDLESLVIVLNHERQNEWPGLFSSLTIRDDSEAQLCPKLSVLDIRTYSGGDDSLDPIVAAILSRWDPPEGPCYLTEVTVSGFSQDITEDPRIAECIEEGLVVETEHY